jgi:CheY-like chemotaxis protein
MNSILGYSELALDGDIPGTTREYLGKIVTNTKWLLRVISDLLDISKIESGNLVLEEIPFDVAEVAEYCHSLFHAEAVSKGLEFLFDTSGLKKKNVRLIGDPTKLTQICVNILSNAVKFTKDGTITLAVSTIGCTENICKYNCDKEACTLKFEIKDTGIGLTKEQIDKIFEPFIQADVGTTRKYGGTGLGLAIAKRIIEAMGGRLMVESAPGAGSTFSFVLDFKTAEIDANSPRSYLEERAELEKPRFNGEEVLIVDDNAMNIGVAFEHLNRVNLKPFIAKNGIEAVDVVKQRIKDGKAPFSLIFMDRHMPEMDGKEAASIINGLRLGTPIIAMTAEVAMQTPYAPYSEHGMSGHLSKPFTTQEMWRCLLDNLPVHNYN